MKRIALIAASAALCAVAPTAAWAQSSTISGTVTVQKGTGPQLTCTATATLDGSSPSTSTEVTGFTLTGGFLGLCATVQFPNTPHSITHGPGSAFTVNNVYADTTFTPGDCEGNLTGTLSGGVVSVNAVLDEVDPGTGDCTVVGSLS